MSEIEIPPLLIPDDEYPEINQDSYPAPNPDPNPDPNPEPNPSAVSSTAANINTNTDC